MPNAAYSRGGNTSSWTEAQCTAVFPCRLRCVGKGCLKNKGAGALAVSEKQETGYPLSHSIFLYFTDSKYGFSHLKIIKIGMSLSFRGMLARRQFLCGCHCLDYIYSQWHISIEI